jgi:hypothetical protein
MKSIPQGRAWEYPGGDVALAGPGKNIVSREDISCQKKDTYELQKAIAAWRLPIT